MEIHGVCSWKPFRQKQAQGFAQLLPRPGGRLAHDVSPAPRRRGTPPGRAAVRGRYLRPGWLLPARIRRTRSGRPSRQLKAVDTRKICPPCTEKRRSSGTSHPDGRYPPFPPVTAARGETVRGQPAAGAHPLHDAAVYLHPVPVHGWRRAELPLAEAPAAPMGSWRGPADGEPPTKQPPGATNT